MARWWQPQKGSSSEPKVRWNEPEWIRRERGCLTWETGIGDLGELGGHRFAFFSAIQRARIVGVGKGISRKEFVIPEDGGAPAVCFDLSESDFGKEPGNAVIRKAGFFRPPFIKGVGNDFKGKNAVFQEMFEPGDGGEKLSFQAVGIHRLRIEFGQFFSSYCFYFIPKDFFGFRGFSHFLFKLDGF